MSCPASPARYPPSSTPNPQPSPSSPRPRPRLSSLAPLTPSSSRLSFTLTSPLGAAVSDPPVFIRLRHPGVRGRDPAAPTAPGAPCSPFTAATQPPDPLNVPVRLRPLPFFSTLNSHYSQLTPSSPSPSSSPPRPPVFRAPRVPALRRGGVSDPPVFRAPRVPSLVRATFLTGLFRSRRLRTYRACPELPKRARVEPHPQAPKPPSPIRLRHPGVFSRDPAAPSRQGAPCQPVQSFIPSATPVRAGFKPASTAPIPTLANPPPFATSPSP